MAKTELETNAVATSEQISDVQSLFAQTGDWSAITLTLVCVVALVFLLHQIKNSVD